MSKTALVTGASRGIGREIALTLGAEGHTVIVNYSGSKDKADAVVEEIKSNGGTAESYQCHVQNADDVKAMIKHITDTYGSIDIVNMFNHRFHVIGILHVALIALSRAAV